MAYAVIAYIVVADIVMADIVMAYIVMAFIVVAYVLIGIWVAHLQDIGVSVSVDACIDIIELPWGSKQAQACV